LSKAERKIKKRLYKDREAGKGESKKADEQPEEKGDTKRQRLALYN